VARNKNASKELDVGRAKKVDVAHLDQFGLEVSIGSHPLNHRRVQNSLVQRCLALAIIDSLHLQHVIAPCHVTQRVYQS